MTAAVPVARNFSAIQIDDGRAARQPFAAPCDEPPHLCGEFMFLMQGHSIHVVLAFRRRIKLQSVFRRRKSRAAPEAVPLDDSSRPPEAGMLKHPP